METYDLIAKDDINNEAARLKAQVMLGWPLEKRKLESLGAENNLTLLDLGCGPGVFTELVAENFPNWTIFGIDSNNDLLPKSSPNQNTNYLNQISGQPIPLESNSVDVVYCRFLFQHLTDLSQTMSEINRVLKPGGIIMVLDVDDRGVIFTPSVDWIKEIYIATAETQNHLKANRQIGAELPQIMINNGFEVIDFEVAPITNYLTSSQGLLNLAFGLKKRFLSAYPKYQTLLTALDQKMADFSAIPGHVILIPIFFCSARKPKN